MTALDFVTALKEAGLTQAQIAEKAQIAQSTVSKIERGDDDKNVLASTYLGLQALYNEVCAKAAG